MGDYKNLVYFMTPIGPSMDAVCTADVVARVRGLKGDAYSAAVQPKVEQMVDTFVRAAETNVEIQFAGRFRALATMGTALMPRPTPRAVGAFCSKLLPQA